MCIIYKGGTRVIQLRSLTKLIKQVNLLFCCIFVGVHRLGKANRLGLEYVTPYDQVFNYLFYPS